MDNRRNSQAELPPRGAPLMTKNEVLNLLNVSYPTLWSWMRDGRFPRARQLVGKNVWIRAEVEAFIADLPVRRFKGEIVRAV